MCAFCNPIRTLKVLSIRLLKNEYTSRVGIPGQPIHGPSMDNRIPIDGPSMVRRPFCQGPSMGNRWDHAELLSMGLRNFCQGIKNTFLRDFYEKRLEINNLHDSIISRECSECKKCIRNRLRDSQIQSMGRPWKSFLGSKLYPWMTHGWTMHSHAWSTHGSSMGKVWIQ